MEAFKNLARRHSSAIREAALEVSPRRQTEMMLLAEGLLEALPERMPKKPPTPSQRRDQNRADRMVRYEECRRLKRLGLSNHEIARRTGMCRETVKKFVCAETFPERVAYPPRSQTTEPYAEYLKKRFQVQDVSIGAEMVRRQGVARMERIKRLPRKEQEFVLRFLDTVLERAEQA